MATMLGGSGPWANNYVRTARKAGRCDYWRGLSRGGRCPHEIAVGERYIEGELSGKAGGFGRDRYCMTHAGDVALAE